MAGIGLVVVITGAGHEIALEEAPRPIEAVVILAAATVVGIVAERDAGAVRFREQPLHQSRCQRGSFESALTDIAGADESGG
jgi:hypothetical protein